jgi:hypothetical protein
MLDRASRLGSETSSRSQEALNTTHTRLSPATPGTLDGASLAQNFAYPGSLPFAIIVNTS